MASRLGWGINIFFNTPTPNEKPNESLVNNFATADRSCKTPDFTWFGLSYNFLDYASFSNNYFQVTQIIDLVTSKSGVKGCPSKNVLLHILFLFISAAEQPIVTIIGPIPHNYGYVSGLTRW